MLVGMDASPLYATENVKKRDLASGVVNSFSSALAIAGFVVLVVRASRAELRGSVEPAFIVGVSLYGACVLFRFVMGSLAGFIGRRGAFRSLDEAGVYFLPAGLLMPLVFSLLEGAGKWLVFASVWAYALLGYVLHLAIVGWYRRYAVSLGYLFFFFVLPLLAPIRASLGEDAFMWIFSGGAFFLIALIFRGKEGFPYAEALWNAFVFAGVALQYLGISSILS
jgi:hemolysin III